MTTFKSTERSAAKVLGIINASMAVLTVICGIACFIIYGALKAKYGSKLLVWPFIGPGLGSVIGGLIWCVVSWFTLKTLYTSDSFAAMLAWGIVNIIFVLPIPLFVLMVIIAKKECK